MEQNAKHFCILFGALSEIPVGEQWQVEVDEDFVYEELPDFFEKSSNLLSAYTQAMQKFQAKYASEREIDDKTTYLFFFDSKAGDRNVNGFMPRNKQFGYIFTQGFSDEENLAIAVAHELGHGQFLLKHPFDNSYKLLQNGLPENLMDYGNGTHLAKWQWDIIKSPGVVNRVFEREGDAMKIETNDLCWNNGNPKWNDVASQKYEAKKELVYDATCMHNYQDGRYRTYYRLRYRP